MKVFVLGSFMKSNGFIPVQGSTDREYRCRYTVVKRGSKYLHFAANGYKTPMKAVEFTPDMEQLFYEGKIDTSHNGFWAVPVDIAKRIKKWSLEQNPAWRTAEDIEEIVSRL